MAYQVAIFLGAFLLFVLQPLIGRGTLPLFGGGAGVWVACLLFFQLVLLGGYAYAHGLAARLTPGARRRLHSMGLVLGVASLGVPLVVGGIPFIASPHLPGAGIPVPALAIVVVLASTCALPLLLLSTTSPLVQALYHRATGEPPFRLYALSNWGSLAGLLTYPLLVEPRAGLRLQGWVAAGLFGVYAGLMLWLLSRDVEVEPAGLGSEPEAVPPSVEESEPAPARPWSWLGLSCLGTVWLLAVSNNLGMEVASVPLIWVLPLGVYLVTFILAFESRWPVQGPAWRLAMVGILLVFVIQQSSGIVLPSLGAALAPHFPGAPAAVLKAFQATHGNLFGETTLTLAALFAGGVLAHGRLADLRPGASKVTAYFLLIAAGGALGGLLVGLVAPMVFSQIYELPLALSASALLAFLGFRQGRPGSGSLGRLALSTATLGFGLVWYVGMLTNRDTLHARDFYGTVMVRFPHRNIMVLAHGSTSHGVQFIKTPLRPAAYFGEESGVGRVLRTLQASRPALRIGVVGLGVGNIAGYGRPADTVTFFEISKKIIGMSGPQGNVFSVLRNSPSKVDVVEGDGRLLLERRQGAPFDVLVIDAFAGGHIPAHLLTREALEIYMRQVAPDGMLLLHTSHHLPLSEQVGATLAAARWPAALVKSGFVLGTDRQGAKLMIEFPSRYWIISRRGDLVFRPEYLQAAIMTLGETGTLPPEREALREAGTKAISGRRAWTDDQNSLMSLLY